nr:hypothetical protein [Bacteroidales bacterium]
AGDFVFVETEAQHVALVDVEIFKYLYLRLKNLILFLYCRHFFCGNRAFVASFVVPYQKKYLSFVSFCIIFEYL